MFITCFMSSSLLVSWITPHSSCVSLTEQKQLPFRETWNRSEIRKKKQQRHRSQLSHDALYNLHEFALDSDFIHHISWSWSHTYCPEILAMSNHLLTRIMEYSPPRRNKPVCGNMWYKWVQCDDCPHWYHTICVWIRNTMAPFSCECI